jgi:glycosyltransferase involved in cell wall biosynthesis
MAMNVPVVSTRVAGVPKLIVDGESGLLVPIADVQALSDAMARVVKDARLRESLSDGGRRVIERDFTFTRRMAKVRAIYDKVLQLDSSAVPEPSPASVAPKA